MHTYLYKSSHHRSRDVVHETMVGGDNLYCSILIFSLTNKTVRIDEITFYFVM